MRRAEDEPPALKRSEEEGLGFVPVIATRVRIPVERSCNPLLHVQGAIVIESQRLAGLGE